MKWPAGHYDPDLDDLGEPHEAPKVDAESLKEREGDTGAGRFHANVPLEEVTEADHQYLARVQREQEEQDERQFAEAIAARRGFRFSIGEAGLPGLLIIAGALSFLALFVAAQASTIVLAVSTIPSGPAWIVKALLAIAVSLVAIAFISLGLLIRRLRTNRPVSLNTLNRLSERERLQKLVRTEHAKAVLELKEYLREYPSPTENKATAKVCNLESCRRRLLENGPASNERWLGAFRETFQSQLDHCAANRIAHHARQAGLFTATSPNAILDALIVARLSLSMIRELCNIYNLRTGLSGSVVLLAHVFLAAYSARRAQDLETVTAKGIEAFIEHCAPAMGGFASEGLMSKAAGKLGARAASGTLNFFMVKRIGEHAQRLLQPVQA